MCLLFVTYAEIPAWKIRAKELCLARFGIKTWIAWAIQVCSSSPPWFLHKRPADTKWSSNHSVVIVFSKHLQLTKCACVHSAKDQGENQQLLPAFLLQPVYIPVLFKASIYICILDLSSLPEEMCPNPVLVQRGCIALRSAHPFLPGGRMSCLLLHVHMWVSCFACPYETSTLLEVLEDPVRLVPCGPPQHHLHPSHLGALSQAGRDAAAWSTSHKLTWEATLDIPASPQTSLAMLQLLCS